MATTTRKSKAKASPEKAPEAPVSGKAQRTPLAQPTVEPPARQEAAVAANHQYTNGNSAPHADIERRAYEIFIARGASHGQDLEDWLKAEREIRDRAES